MDSFISLLCFMGSHTDDDSPRFDMLGNFPPEMAINILRLLDAATLLSSALVNKTWLALIRSDSVLRSRLRHHLRRLRKDRAKPLNIRFRVLRNGSNSRPFDARNERFEMKRIPTKQGDSRECTNAPVIIIKGGKTTIRKTIRKAKDATRLAVGNFLGLPSNKVTASSRPSSQQTNIIGYNGISVVPACKNMRV